MHLQEVGVGVGRASLSSAKLQEDLATGGSSVELDENSAFHHAVPSQIQESGCGGTVQQGYHVTVLQSTRRWSWLVSEGM